MSKTDSDNQRERPSSKKGSKSLEIMHVRSIRDIIDHFRMNRKEYIQEYSLFLILTMFAALADTVSTVCFMLRSGPDAERHPAIRVVSIVLGPVLGPIVGKLCQFTVVIALTVNLRRWAVYIFIVVIILYTWAAWYNVWG